MSPRTIQTPQSDRTDTAGNISADHHSRVTRLFIKHHASLKRMVERRISPAIRGRLDPSDVVQEAYLEISRQSESFSSQCSTHFLPWAIQITRQVLAHAHRRHLGVQKRNVMKEVRMESMLPSDGVADSFPRVLSEPNESPSRKAIHHELETRVCNALLKMEELDRQIIMLRHFSQLSNRESAKSLGLSKTAASNRYIRALSRLRRMMDKTESSQ